MGYTVIIAEKPSVAGGIAKIVGANTSKMDKACGYKEGNGYRVTWAFGHLVGLQSPEEMGFVSGVVPMLPEEWKTKVLGRRGKDGKVAPDPMVEKQMKTIKSLFDGADRIIVATDAGREGELIFRYIYEYLGCRTPFDRLWISSLTDEAIRSGLASLKDGRQYDALSDAAHARSEADWLVGFNASRALRLATGFRGNLSLGRVQTPTLGMICERYDRNRNFVPTPFWVVEAQTGAGGTAFKTVSEQNYKVESDADKALALTIRAHQLVVESVEKKQKKTTPPLLYDLTALQRAANSKFGLTADDTLKTAQSLYEKKYLTYPRTGSRYIPDDVFKTIPSLLKKVEGVDRFGDAARALAGKKLCRKSVNDAKVTDHHALLPTENIPHDLSGNELKIWEMVCGRMLEAFGEDYVSDNTKVIFDAGGVKYKSTGSVPVLMGWKGVFGADAVSESDKKDDDEGDGRLPDLREGQVLPVGHAEKVQKTDKPLPIFTDASLLEAMETCGKKVDDEELREAMKDVGLGTPATRAATIEGLLMRNYIRRDGKKLVPTDFGLQVWGMVKGRKISDVATTGEWERDLAHVEQGRLPVKTFNDRIKDFVLEIIDDLNKNCKPLDGISATGESARTCPVCGKQMKNGKFSIWCSEESGGCGLKIPREVCGKKLPATALSALCNGKKTAEIKGFKSKAGKVFSAALRVDLEAKKVAFVFDDKPQAPKVEGLVCPKCGKPLSDGKYSLSCGCGLKINKSLCEVTFTANQLRDLVAGKEVNGIGFKGKKGHFNAKVKFALDENKLKFLFDKK